MQLNLNIDSETDFGEAWSNYLTSMFNYKQAQIMRLQNNETSALGLLVFRDEEKTQPYLGIYNEQPTFHKNQNNGILQTKYLVIGMPSSFRVFEVSRYGELVNSLTVPFSTNNNSWKTRLTKPNILLPFDDEQVLRSIIKRVHNEIYNASAKDPASAFDIISVILISKIYDEFNGSNSFYVFDYEKKEDYDGKLRSFIAEALKWAKLPFSDSQKEFYINLIASLPKHALKRIFQLLRDYSLITTTTHLSGTDILGVIYERVVSSTFRGELGSYFTPKNIVDFMVRFIELEDNDKIFDPSCGSSGFLIASANYAKIKQLKSFTLYGNDINPRMVLATKLNYLIHKIKEGYITELDGLEIYKVYRDFNIDIKQSDERKYIEQSELSFFDKILANPPFAGFEKNADLLKNFVTAHNGNGSIKSLNKIIPFVELIIACLKIDGKAGIVVPVSVLNAEEHSFVKLRSLIKEKCKITAIIGLPKYAFVHTGCGVEGALIFLERVSKKSNDYEIFIDLVNNLGYDRLGKPTTENDLPKILEHYKSGKWKDDNKVKISELSNDLRLDPAWLLYSKHSKKSSSTEEFIDFGTLFEFREERIQRKLIDNNAVYKYFEVGDADINTGNIAATHAVSGYELKKKGRIKNIVHKGDVLLPNHRDSLLAKTSKGAGRSAVIVSKDYDGYLTTDRFIVLIPKINSIVLQQILNSGGVRNLLVSNSRGSASLDIRPGVLLMIKIPKKLVDLKMQQKIISLHLNMEKLRNQLSQRAQAIKEIIGANVIQA